MRLSISPNSTSLMLEELMSKPIKGSAWRWNSDLNEIKTDSVGLTETTNFSRI